MKAFLAIGAGLILLLLPLWGISGFVVVPEHRTGTISDYRSALIAGFTLYGGVLMGVAVSRRYKFQQRGSVMRRTFVAGVAGAMAAIALVVLISFLIQWFSTGYLVKPGQSLGLLPIPFIVGGLIGSIIAAGAGLIAHGLHKGGQKRAD